MKNILFVLFFLLAFSSIAQQIEKSVYGEFALINLRIETVSEAGLIENGIILIRDGKIAAVGIEVDIPSSAQQIDCAGLTAYPGLIDGGTRLGLFEIGSISLTQDTDEPGDFTPQVRALTAVNPNSILIPVTRVNGVTTVLSRPSGGLFPGTAALIDLHGYNPDQMAAGFEGVVLQFPRSGKRNRWDRRSEEEIKEDEEKALKKLNEAWEEAMRYARIDSSGASGDLDYNPQLASLSGVINDDFPLLVEVNKKEDILRALTWVVEKEIGRAILTGVAEGWRVADSIAAAGIPVITGPVLELPTRDSDPYDAAYTNAGMMQKAGVQVALQTDEAANVRNLPYHAGFAATYGMGREEALRAVTLVPAQIFGLADEIGSIEAGKRANVVIADGDIFETKTQVKHLFIGGWKVPLESRHTLLYDEFLDRSPGVENK